MLSLTTAQRALLAARDDQCKMALEIDDTSPLRYCTGSDAIQIDSNWHDPRGMKFNKVALTDPRTSRTTVTLDDSDGDIRTAWYSSKFDCAATVWWFLRAADGSWTEVLEIAWTIEECSFDRSGNFTVSLSAAAGTRPRYGGMIGSRSEFPYAPEPGEALRLGTSGGVTFKPGVGMPPPPPGGQQNPYFVHQQQLVVNTAGITAPISDTPNTSPSGVITSSS